MHCSQPFQADVKSKHWHRPFEIEHQSVGNSLATSLRSQPVTGEATIVAYLILISAGRLVTDLTIQAMVFAPYLNMPSAALLSLGHRLTNWPSLAQDSGADQKTENSVTLKWIRSGKQNMFQRYFEALEYSLRCKDKCVTTSVRLSTVQCCLNDLVSNEDVDSLSD